MQIAQRGIAGAEIIQRDVNAEFAQLCESRQGRLIVADQHGFGDFKLEAARIEPGIGERGRDIERKRLRLELHR